jgi:imidazole glycerol-phosphate synthase subunit HisF
VVLALDAASAAPSQREGLGGGFGASTLVRDCIEPSPQPPPSGRGSWKVVTHSGRDRTGLDVIQWAERAAELGAGEILLTSWDRDGTGLGYDLDLLRAITSSVAVPVIASGGAKTPEHLAAAADAGASAVLAATIFHDAMTTVGTVKRRLAALGKTVRPQQGAPR